jgi:hypothetical protein
VLAAFNEFAGEQNLPCKEAAATADRYPHEPSIVVALLFVHSQTDLNIEKRFSTGHISCYTGTLPQQEVLCRYLVRLFLLS